MLVTSAGAPSFSARNRSQQGFLSSTDGTPARGASNTAGTTVAPAALVSNQQLRLRASNSRNPKRGLGRPLGFSSRRGSRSADSATASVSNLKSGGGVAGGAATGRQRRPVHSASHSSNTPVFPASSSKATGTGAVKASGGVPSVPDSGESSITNPAAFSPTFVRKDAAAAVATTSTFKSGASAHSIGENEGTTQIGLAPVTVAGGGTYSATSGECGASERVTPGAASSINTTVIACPTPTLLTVFWNLTAYEEEEIHEYLPEVYFTGSIPASEKIQVGWPAKGVSDGGYDDENYHYRVKLGDHIAYRYEIVKELGRGTFGVVISAIDHKCSSNDSNHGADNGGEYGREGAQSGRSSNGSCHPKRRVAIKLIKNKPAYTKQAKEEARLLDILVSHDPNDEANVVRLLETFTFRSHYVLVFELLQNDLYSYMQANNYRPFTQRFISVFAECTLKALDYLSRHGIVHCDIKPENIAVDASDVNPKDVPPPQLAHGSGSLGEASISKKASANVSAASSPRHRGGSKGDTQRSSDDLVFRRFKLIDFGSSCTVDKRVFTYIQSRYYRAPEIVLGIPYTTAIDMWSFGCVLCELANGTPLFPASCEGELLERMTEYFGPVPAYLIAKGKRVDKFFAPPSGGGGSKTNGPPERAMLPGLSKNGRKRKAPHSRNVYSFLAQVREKNGREEAHLFHDFVSQCLILDPALRITPGEALQHPWIQKWRAVYQ